MQTITVSALLIISVVVPIVNTAATTTLRATTTTSRTTTTTSRTTTTTSRTTTTTSRTTTTTSRTTTTTSRTTTTTSSSSSSTTTKQACFAWNPNGMTVAGGNGQGSAANQFSNPTTVAVSSTGNIYICDFGNNRIQMWKSGATQGSTIWPPGGIGSKLNQSNGTIAFVFIESSNLLYILDYNNSRVLKWTIGTNAASIVAGGNGVGSALNQLSNGSSSIAVDRSSNVYVLDIWNSRVVKWAPGSKSGQIVAGGNGAGSDANQLMEPMNIVVDSQYNLYIADAGNLRIQMWQPGGTSGVTLSSADFMYVPMSLALDSVGNIYIGAIGSIFMWSATNQNITVIIPSFGNSSMILSGPVSLSLSSNNKNLFATDMLNNAITKYSLMNC